GSIVHNRPCIFLLELCRLPVRLGFAVLMIAARPCGAIRFHPRASQSLCAIIPPDHATISLAAIRLSMRLLISFLAAACAARKPLDVCGVLQSGHAPRSDAAHDYFDCGVRINIAKMICAAGEAGAQLLVLVDIVKNSPTANSGGI